MANQYFSVKEQLFDIEFTNRELVHELQNRISDLANHRLMRAMNNCFEDIVPENILIKIDSLTLDLGEVSYDSLEEELETKIIDQLTQQILQQVEFAGENNAFDSNETIEYLPGNEQLLEFFLLNGTFPWWFQESGGFTLDGLIDEMFRQNPQDLRELVIRAGKNEYVKKRLVYQFSEKSIRQVITVLEPSEAAYIFSYHEEVKKIQQEEQVVQAESTAFEKAVWLFILTYLLDERGSQFSRKEFVKSSLVQMSAYFNVNYFELLTVFYKAVSINPITNLPGSSFEKVIRELAFEEDDQRLPLNENEYTGRPKTDDSDAEQFFKKTELLLYYFRHGSLPQGVNEYSNESLAQFFSDAAVRIPTSLKIMLKQLENTPAFAIRFKALFGQEGARLILHTLYPGTAKLLTTLSSLVELWQTKKQFTATGSKEFLFLATIHAVIFERGTRDDSMLVKSFLQLLAEKYQQDGTTFINEIHRLIVQEFRQGIQNSNLPQLIHSIVYEMEAAQPEPVKEKASVQSTTEEPVTERGLEDVLTYLLQYGNIPWWGKDFFATETVDSLLQQLFVSSPSRMLQLFRFAGTELRMQRRLLVYANAETLFALLTLLPYGPSAILAIQQVNEWFSKGTTTIIPDMEKILFHALWEESVEYGYRSFTLAGFYTRAVFTLSEQLAAEPRTIIEFILQGSDVTDSTIDSAISNRKNILTEIAGLLKLQKSTLPATADPQKNISTLISNIPAGSFDEQEILINRIIAGYADNDKDVLANEVQSIIKYFLTWNRLPDIIELPTGETSTTFLRQLFMLLYTIDDAKLVVLLQEAYGSLALVEPILTSLFDKNKGSSEKQLSALIQNAIPVQPLSAQRIENETGILNNELDQIKKHIETTITPGQPVTGEQLSLSAFEALSYFLANNRLPDQWKETITLGATGILKQLMLILYKEDRIILQRLLQNQEHNIPARLFFHELVSETSGGTEKEVALLIKPYINFYQQKELERLQPVIRLQEPKEKLTEEDKRRTAMADSARLINWIDLFLTTGETSVTSVAGIDEELVSNTIQLYITDKPGLEKILKKDGHLPAARIRLHDLFMSQTGYYEREILNLLQQHWQKDLMALLAANQVSIDHTDPAGFVSLLLQLLGNEKKTARQNELWQLAASSPLFIRYIIADAEPQVLQVIIQQNGTGWGNDTVDFMHIVRNIFAQSIPDSLERDKMLSVFQQFNLLFISGKWIIKSREDYLRAFFSYAMQLSHQLPQKIFASVLMFTRQKNTGIVQELGSALSIMQERLRELINRLDNNESERKEKQRNERLIQEIAEQETARQKERLEQIRTELERERLIEQERLKKESEKLKDDKHNKIYIRNAGLVLLHPFLGTYFARLGLIEKGAFINEELRQRAVLLLQYLVNGRNVFEEFELPLNKILCGVPVEETIPLDIVLSETEITVSAELFKVIFERWEKMKNSSVESFRASFIQREGALLREEENWTLNVEQRSYDLLLQTLPWAFGMIKNAWMTQILTVEWT